MRCVISILLLYRKPGADRLDDSVISDRWELELRPFRPFHARTSSASFTAGISGTRRRVERSRWCDGVMGANRLDHETSRHRFLHLAAGTAAFSALLRIASRLRTGRVRAETFPPLHAAPHRLCWWPPSRRLPPHPPAWCQRAHHKHWSKRSAPRA